MNIIIDPITKRKYNIYSQSGKKILKKYVTQMIGGLPDNDRTPYQVLGINPNATSKEIRKAYRNKALQFHPDKKHPKSAIEFPYIQDAYEFLSDQEKRKRYNNNIGNHGWLPLQPQQQPPQPPQQQPPQPPQRQPPQPPQQQRYNINVRYTILGTDKYFNKYYQNVNMTNRTEQELLDAIKTDLQNQTQEVYTLNNYRLEVVNNTIQVSLFLSSINNEVFYYDNQVQDLVDIATQ